MDGGGEKEGRKGGREGKGREGGGREEGMRGRRGCYSAASLYQSI